MRNDGRRDGRSVFGGSVFGGSVFGRRAQVLGLAAVLVGCDVYDPAFLGRLDGGGGVDASMDGGAEIDAGTRDGGSEDAGSEDAGREDAGSEDAGSEDAGSDAGDVDSGPTGCPLRRWPMRPSVADGSGMELVFALRNPVIDQTSGEDLWSNVGYDLDGTCTEDAGDEHLCVPPGLPSPPLDGVADDGGRGVDNVIGSNLFPAIRLVQPDFIMDAQRSMARGDTLLIRIRNWNGEDDDPSVEAAFGQSIGGSGLRRADGMTTPQWDGLDEWSLSNENFAAGNPNSPNIRDTAAYIRDRTLVFRIPDRETIFIPWTDTFSLPMRLTDARFTGRISDDGTRLENVRFVGRWAKSDFDAAFDAVGVCDPASRVGLDIAVNNNLDVRSAPDTGGVGVVCDAMSLAVGFTGLRAIWGPVTDPLPRPPNPCE